MIIGILAIWLGLCAIVTATLSYALAMQASRAPRKAASRNGKRRSEPEAAPPDARAASFLHLGRRAFYVSAACVAVAAIVQMCLILGRHYEIKYIYEHTGNNLPIQYRIAAFWAGQEGTFLLWTLYAAVMGVLLIPRSRSFEPYVMPFFCAAQLFLFLLLTVMSPFALVEQPELVAGAAGSWQAAMRFFGLAHVFRPPDGQGLTPLLQNYWMVIHPPTIFVGFATLVIPAAFALGALMKRDYDGWIELATPWACFAWMILGIGIFLGGYWAYETLGWGGYWAWDPVENASVVPWIFTTAAIHGMLAQRSRKSLKQANLFMAIAAYFAFIYGTFLTRSGVLAEFSVHSFVAPGRVVYLMMVGFMLLLLGGGLGLWFRRLPDIRGESAYDSLTERHFGLFLAAVLLIGSGVIIGLGMSFPLIAPLFIGKKGSLSVVAYNRAMVPIGTFVALLMAATPLMPWRHADGVPRPWKPSQKLVYGLCLLVLIGGIPAALAAWTGARPPVMPLISTDPAGSGPMGVKIGPFPPDYPALWVFAAAVALALLVNIGMFIKSVRNGILTCGAWVAHVGIALTLAGVLITSVFSQQQEVRLAKGESQEAFGYTFRYLGLTPGKGVPGDRDHLRFDVSRGSDRMLVKMPYYQAKMDGGQEQLILNPAIRKYWSHDLYMSPSQQSDGTAGVELAQGQSDRVGGYTITFKRFEVPGASEHRANDEPITARAVLEVTRGGQTKTLRPAYVVSPTEVHSVPETMPGGDYDISIFKIVTETGSVQLLVTPLSPTDVATIEVSYKPWINVLWLGGLFMASGCFLAWRRRILLVRRASEREEARERVPVPSPRRVLQRRPAPVSASSKQ
jgi:cytochrome c-type biogenesis protein CcmF